MRLLLLPGLDGTGQLFGPLLAHLAASFDTDIVSFPRTEILSQDDLVGSVRERLGAERPTIFVAESYSGPLALKVVSSYADPRAEGIFGVVLVASFVRPPLPCAAIVRRLPLALLLQLTRGSITGIRFALTGWRAPITLARAVRTAVRSVEPRVLAARIRESLRVEVADELASMAVPVFYLTGRRDCIVRSARVAHELVRLNPSVRVRLVDSGPHLLLQVMPPQAVTAIQEFVRDLTAVPLE